MFFARFKIFFGARFFYFLRQLYLQTVQYFGHTGRQICRQYNTLDPSAAPIADSTALWTHRPACLQTVQHLAVQKWVSLEVGENAIFQKNFVRKCNIFLLFKNLTVQHFGYTGHYPVVYLCAVSFKCRVVIKCRVSFSLRAHKHTCKDAYMHTLQAQAEGIPSLATSSSTRYPQPRHGAH